MERWELGTSLSFAAKNFKMEDETLRSTSKRMGITSRETLKKAAEFQRLMDVRCFSLALNSVAKPVICLELAAQSSQVPVDKDMAIRLSGMNKKAYIHAFKTVERLLEKQREFTIKDLAVQFGCMEASNVGQHIYDRYKQDCVQDVESISHPVFVGAALYTACKHQKIKIDKTKLLNLLVVKRATFEGLHKEMEKIVPTLESVDYSKRTSKRRYGLLDKVNEIVEEQSHASKHPKAEENDTSTEDREYEEWKQRIVESATKALFEKKKSKETTTS